MRPRQGRPVAAAGQRGQAIVLIAIMLAVLIGMVALALDGARGYAIRRDLQSAIDAASLAAADGLQRGGSYPVAEQSATAVFAADLRLYAAPSCGPYGAPGASPFTVTCTFSDATVLTQTVSNLGPQGSSFAISATRTVQLEFARVLTSGNSLRVAAAGTSGVGNLVNSPTLAALDSAGCGGTSGASFNEAAGGTLTVLGDVVSNGAVTVNGTLQVGGDLYATCQPTVAHAVSLCYPSGLVPPCTYPDVAGSTRSGYHVADPGYPPPPLSGVSQPHPLDAVVLSPGTYASDPAFQAQRCYFLAGGVYNWQGGYTNNGAFVSNELKPPDEPKVSDNTKLASHQLWNADGANCAGSAQVTSVAGSKGISNGTWAFVITSTRTAFYNGVAYLRESAPSVCYTTFVNGAGRNVQIQISNVPGATAYNIYAAPSGSCAGPFGLATSVAVAGTEQNNSTASCPMYSGTGCSLGNETILLDATVLGPPFAPNLLAPPGVLGSPPPSSETAPVKNNLANDNADRAPPPDGDRANENQCDSVGGALVTCPGRVTPGAVEFYIPSGACLNDSTQGDNLLFGGYQYDWIVVYEPGRAFPPANTCANFLGAATDSAYIGFIYAPAASLNIQKASTFRTDETGGVMADTITFTGQLPTIIGDPADYGPAPPASRLIS